jgi:hypothetical protein
MLGFPGSQTTTALDAGNEQVVIPENPENSACWRTCANQSLTLAALGTDWS